MKLIKKLLYLCFIALLVIILPDSIKGLALIIVVIVWICSFFISDKEKQKRRQEELRREKDNENAERMRMYKEKWWGHDEESIITSNEPVEKKKKNNVSLENPYRNIVRKHLEELWLLSYYKELLPNPNADFIEDTRMIALIIDGKDHELNLERDLKKQEEMEKFAWIVLRINESEIKRVKIDKEKMYARYKINRNIKPEESNYWEILRALCHIHIGVRYNSKWYSWVDVPTGNELRYLYPWNKRRAFPGIEVNTVNKGRNFIHPKNDVLEAYEFEQSKMIREVLETPHEAPELWSGTVSSSKKDGTDVFEF